MRYIRRGPPTKRRSPGQWVVTPSLPRLLPQHTLTEPSEHTLGQVLAALSRREGYVTRSEARRAAVSKYFYFLLVQVLLIQAVAGSLSGALTAVMRKPTSLVALLGAKLPQTSTFFMLFILLKVVCVLPAEGSVSCVCVVPLPLCPAP